MELQSLLLDLGRRARQSAHALALLSNDQRSAILLAMAQGLVDDEAAILHANAQDLARATDLSPVLRDRLHLTPERFQSIIHGLRSVAELPNPVNTLIREWTVPSGLHISKIRKPIGVIGIIYESRPNVTCDVAGLCIKTANAILLRGGSESIYSNQALVQALQKAGHRAGLPHDAIQLVPVTDREAVRYLAEMKDYIDVIIPRGGKQLIETVMRHAQMPVIKHYEGICHTYVDQDADLQMAERIALNAKCQRPSVCNAMETLILHRHIAQEFLQQAAPAFAQEKVELRGDSEAFALLQALDYHPLIHATEADWNTEYLDKILSIRIVPDVHTAIAHINTYGSHHSDAIVTRDPMAAEVFLNAIDSATVYWNASTRFTDGGEFGFGTEMGISTDKLHPRGPMGLEELTTYRYLIRGAGQVRE